MAALVHGNFSTSSGSVDQFLERHFTKIAFAVSALALLILSPLHLFLGAAVGFAIHFYTEPKLILGSRDPIVTIPNALFSIVGAFASLLSLTSAGATGGYLFKAIPFISSLAVGSTVYRGVRWCSAK